MQSKREYQDILEGGRQKGYVCVCVESEGVPDKPGGLKCF